MEHGMVRGICQHKMEHRREITAEVAGQIEGYIQAGHTKRVIAKYLRVSLYVVEKIAERMATPQESAGKNQGPKHPWTKQEEAALISMHNAGFAGYVIAEALGRSQKSVDAKRDRLRRTKQVKKSPRRRIA